MPSQKSSNSQLFYIGLGLAVIIILFLLLAWLALNTPTQSPIDESLVDNFSSTNLVTLQNASLAPTESATSPTLGLAEAPITIFQFSCFACPDSAAVQPIVTEILKRYEKEVRLVWKDAPLADTFPGALVAHQAARCAHQQNQFWPYANRLWPSQADLSLTQLKNLAAELNLNLAEFDQCLTDPATADLIEQDQTEATNLGIAGTPHFFVNRQELVGRASVDDFVAVIQAELSR